MGHRTRLGRLGFPLVLVLAWLVPAAAGAHPGLQTRPLLEDVPPGIGVLVNSPDGLAGFLPAIQWSGTAEVDDQTADLVYVGRGCTPLDYTGRDVEGKIALVDEVAQESTCPPTTFFQRMQLAERNGAIGVVNIRADNATDGRTAVVAGIPGLELTRDNGAAVLSAVVGGTAVNVTLKDTPAPPTPPSGTGVLVNEPEELAGFRAAEQWGGTARLDGQTADFVYAGTGCTAADYATVDVEGKIALIDEFDGAAATDQCLVYTYAQKASAAEDAGAIGLVQVDSDDDVSPGSGAAGIPVVSIANSAGKPLRDAVLDGQTVNVTLIDTREALEAMSDIPCQDGMAGPFECEGVDLLGFVPAEEFNGAGQSDLWGWTDPETGDDYVMMGKTNGTALFRVTDPTAPVYVGEVPNPALEQAVWHDVKVYANHAFIVSESDLHGMLVFDLTRLRDVDDDDEPQQFEPDATYPLNYSAHNIAINEDTGYAYIVGGNIGSVVPDQCLSGLHIVDINDPKNPQFAGCYARDGGPGTAARTVGEPATSLSPVAYVHDTQCVVYDGPDERYTGREICFNASENKVTIVDVDNKALPLTLGVTGYEAVTYAHQGWLTEDHSFLLVNDELDVVTEGNGVDTTRTIVLDVRDLENPTVHFIHDHGFTSSAHNNYVHEGLVYQSNYSSGLRVLDVGAIDDEQNPRLEPKAFFDVFPWDDADPSAAFDGTWSNYPYFESGTVAVSGRGEGLFLLRLAEDGGQESIDLACGNCPVEIRAGGTGTAEITATNDGDRDGTYDIAVGGVPDDWNVDVAPQQVVVPAGESQVVTVTITVPRRERAGSSSLTVTATSLRDPGIHDSADVPVEVVKGRPSNALPKGAL